MKSLSITLLCLLLSLLSGASSCGAASYSAQDSDLTVDPVIRFFPVTGLGSYSEAAVFTITNKSASEPKIITAVSLGGPHADQFALDSGADTCTGATLAVNGGSCAVSVKFHPTTRGSKAANVLIQSDDTQTPVLTAFVTNTESAGTEAARRLPPVLSALDISETLAPSMSYTITWSLEGYGSSYTTYAVLFDCTGIADDCGANYGDTTRLIESGSLSPISTETGSWTYNGVQNMRFNYSWIFTVPALRTDGSSWPEAGTDVVVRFYHKDSIDQERNGGSITLMIPGNLADRYYDATGRRIVTRIKP